ncbi:MAG: cell division protein SepF [Candidatus Nanoarchaeia archaeon]|nr:cell division protein SepF [Candidatus Nanoarchaeia archaeon]MDD5239796.1 cell division protein SepF [Candidatus Nanoarchaeia archaeon]
MGFKDFMEKLTGKVTIKKGNAEEEFIELEPSEMKKKAAKIFVKYFILTDFADIKGVIDALREGYTVALIKIKPLKDKDMNELKRAISKVKRTCEAIDGEIVGIDEDWIIAVPSFIEVFKGESGVADGTISDDTNEEI